MAYHGNPTIRWLFEILGVQRGDLKEVQRLRQKWMQKNHPDKNPSEESREKSQLVNAAYDVFIQYEVQRQEEANAGAHSSPASGFAGNQGYTPPPDTGYTRNPWRAPPPPAHDDGGGMDLHLLERGVVLQVPNTLPAARDPEAIDHARVSDRAVRHIHTAKRRPGDKNSVLIPRMM